MAAADPDDELFTQNEFEGSGNTNRIKDKNVLFMLRFVMIFLPQR